jgi:hypothetical protein
MHSRICFQSFRSRTPIPGPHDFKVSLRLVTLSQYECQIIQGNYDTDMRTHLISYCKSKTKDTEEKCNEYVSADIEMDTPADESDKVKQALYYLLGSLIHSLTISCAKCISALTPSSDETIEPSLLTHLI